MVTFSLKVTSPKGCLDRGQCCWALAALQRSIWGLCGWAHGPPAGALSMHGCAGLAPWTGESDGFPLRWNGFDGYGLSFEKWLTIWRIDMLFCFGIDVGTCWNMLADFWLWIWMICRLLELSSILGHTMYRCMATLPRYSSPWQGKLLEATIISPKSEIRLLGPEPQILSD